MPEQQSIKDTLDVIRKALEDDENFLSDQEKLETSETQINQ